MPKPNAKAPSKKKGKGKLNDEPEDENDFLEAADDHEKGGRKWRAGDAVKASRFFVRAIDVYNAGLKKYPRSFDLAYNKAHLQFEIIQDPRIAPHLGSRLDLLSETLQTHRYALTLNEENADAVFNTAQVLTTLAEELEDNVDDPGRSGAIKLLQEAIELFSSCLSRQEMQFNEQQSVNADQTNEPDAAVERKGASNIMEDTNQWVSVEEPITGSTLLETALAQLSALETLAALSAPCDSRTLATISELAAPLIRTKIPQYISLISTAVSKGAENSTPSVATLSITGGSNVTFTPSKKPVRETNPQEEAKEESAIALATFQAALADAEYQSNLSDIDTYASRLRDAFEPILQQPDPNSHPAPTSTIHQYTIMAAIAYSEALYTLSSTAASGVEATSTTELHTTVLAVLERAKTVLDAILPAFVNPGHASSEISLPEIKKAQLFIIRGDISLKLRSNPEEAAAAEESYTHASTHATVALQTSEVGEDGTTPGAVLEEAKMKRAIASYLASSGSNVPPSKGIQQQLTQQLGLKVERYRQILTSAVEDGILRQSDAQLWAG